MIARPGTRVAIAHASGATERDLRARYGLAPGFASVVPHALGYAGREFRAYPYMRVGEAVRFYAALQRRWNAVSLASALDVAGLANGYEIRRMKRAYQRALVLAFALAAEPDVLVVEGGEEFDEPAARALLRRAVADVATVIVTFAGDVADERAWFDAVLDGGEVAA